MESKIHKQLSHQILDIQNNNFDDVAIQLFQYQAKHNEIYGKYIKLLGKDVNSIKTIEEIPFLPISFFKTFEIK